MRRCRGVSAALLWTIAPYAALPKPRRAPTYYSTVSSAPTARPDAQTQAATTKTMHMTTSPTSKASHNTQPLLQLREQYMLFSNTTISTRSARLARLETNAGQEWSGSDASGAPEVATLLPSRRCLASLDRASTQPDGAPKRCSMQWVL